MNFFKKIFQTEESENPTIDDKTSTKACIALLLETSMADEILDESELVILKNISMVKFQTQKKLRVRYFLTDILLRLLPMVT